MKKPIQRITEKNLHPSNKNKIVNDFVMFEECKDKHDAMCVSNVIQGSYACDVINIDCSFTVWWKYDTAIVDLAEMNERLESFRSHREERGSSGPHKAATGLLDIMKELNIDITEESIGHFVKNSGHPGIAAFEDSELKAFVKAILELDKANKDVNHKKAF